MSAINDFASSSVSIERKGAIGTLWLDRTDKRNAMNPALWNGIIAGLDALESDGETRAIVLAGRGHSFCVGLDLAMLGGGGAPTSDGGDAGDHASFAGKHSGATANLRQLEMTKSIQVAIT